MPGSDTTIAYGGLTAGAAEIAYIRDFTHRFAGLSRTELTATLCEHLDWLTAAGNPRFNAAAQVLTRLEKSGAVQLPAIRKDKAHPGLRARAEGPVIGPMEPGEPLRGRLDQLPPVRLSWATDEDEVARCNQYLDHFHPLGYKRPFGYPGRYLIEAGEHELGCILLGGPARALSARERWIGWTEPQRRQNLSWVVNNSRFLIFPWVEVANLASHVLGQLARRVADDWERHWGFRPLLLETFVDPTHYRGSCYRAAGWESLGRTTGRGLARPGKTYRSTAKLLFTKPLQADFRRLLCSDLSPKGGSNHERAESAPGR